MVAPDRSQVPPQVRGEKWSKLGGYVAKATSIMKDKQAAILKDVPADRQDEAKALFEQVAADLAVLRDNVGEQKVPLLLAHHVLARQDPWPLSAVISQVDKVEKQKAVALRSIGSIEALMVHFAPRPRPPARRPPSRRLTRLGPQVPKFPYQVPAEYASLPRLEGRAEVPPRARRAHRAERAA
jgi:hypothetical protein